MARPTGANLVRALERASKRKLKDWAEAWVKSRGMPEVRLSWDTDREAAAEHGARAARPSSAKGALGR